MHRDLSFIELSMVVAGNAEFTRRIVGDSNRYLPDKSDFQLRVISGTLAEIKSLCLVEKPHILVFNIGSELNPSELLWLRQMLSALRERFGKKLYIIMSVSSSEVFGYAGSLLFATEESLEPSGLIDNMIITAPPGFLESLTLELQLRNCLGHLIEVFECSHSGYNFLPALWDSSWTPSMCDPESRNVWMRWVPRYAQYVNENPLILGPTGSGKTRLASALHQLSGRSGPFVSITPRDFSTAELVQAELFGAVAGAYTGAVDKWGLVKKADKGTLFIDELQSIDLDLQGKLITFIENKTYRRVGDASSHQADVRFIFASNVSLPELVKTGRLRDDFAYRLERLQMQLKPLSERRLDIAAGLCFAMARLSRERKPREGSDYLRLFKDRFIQGASREAYQLLFGASWPGNLRQLDSITAQLVELSDIANLRLIDEQSAHFALKNMLGKDEDSSDLAKQVTSYSIGEEDVEKEHTAEELLLLEESISSVVLERLDDILAEAFSVAKKW